MFSHWLNQLQCAQWNLAVPLSTPALMIEPTLFPNKGGFSLFTAIIYVWVIDQE